ncbi:MAG: hypothetical protein DRO01_05250 [Thermoproteota archaeon]|nr:MAG: hypothetical protein DRO01_05250 [Candidatus Korarchaeota archaeon]
MSSDSTGPDLSLTLAVLDKRIDDLESRLASLENTISKLRDEETSISERVDRLVRRVLEGTVILAAIVIASMMLLPSGRVAPWLQRSLTLAALGGAVVLWAILRLGSSRLERRRVDLEREISKRALQLEDLEAEARALGRIRTALAIAHGGAVARAYEELSDVVLRMPSSSEALEAILIGLKALAEGAPREYAVRLAAGLERRAWEQPQDSWERAALLAIADALTARSR